MVKKEDLCIYGLLYASDSHRNIHTNIFQNNSKKSTILITGKLYFQDLGEPGIFWGSGSLFLILISGQIKIPGETYLPTILMWF